ncbi:MAG: D-alanyl-D-alanine carboxypeptidase/D-alanyl-D-alanine-endopeptidase [Flavisolibacter sp.]
MYDGMKKLLSSFILLFVVLLSFEQNTATRLKTAFNSFEKDSQLLGGLASLYVLDTNTGNVIFESNAGIGLQPASTQKIITAVSAYELLGKDFSYQTKFTLLGPGKKGSPEGNIFIQGSGDPTLGSWRWKQTSENTVLENIAYALKKKGLKKIKSILISDEGWQTEMIPDGWIWQDLGNYYGAPAHGFNWRENQYDLVLNSGQNMGDSIKVTGTQPKLYPHLFVSYAKAAAKGTGDKLNIYLPLNGSFSVITGSIPINEKKFIVSGAMPDVKKQFAFTLADYLSSHGINCDPTGESLGNSDLIKNPHTQTIINTQASPPLDSMVYWFLKKSINLYGEAFIKTIAARNGEAPVSENGIVLVKKFWSERGIATTELNMVDGSGLSPLNQVSTRAQVGILKYATLQGWFPGFYYSLPEYNGMKMKSGTIGGVKGFCGYQTSSDGHNYIFSFLVNNYNGATLSIVQKMYQVLNELK